MKKSVRGIFKAYDFKEHNPVLDALDRVYELAGMLDKRGRPRYEAISMASTGVSTHTLKNWRKRKVKRPQQPTLEAVLRGLGAESAILYKGHTIRFGPGRRVVGLRVIEGGKRRAG
jgi:hypothetical protein